MTKKKLLSIGHSYVLGVNRTLVNEMAKAGGERWHVCCVAPRYFHGGADLGPQIYRRGSEDIAENRVVRAYGSRNTHFFLYEPALRNILRDRWDIVHVWEEPFNASAFQAACFTRSPAKLVVRTAQSKIKKYPIPFNMMERYVMGKAAGWICSGGTVRDTLLKKPMYRAKPMSLIPLGVDLRIFFEDEKAGEGILRRLGWAGEDVPVIGYLGRFVPAKGLSLLMRVLDRLSLPWRGLFVGNGVLEQDMRRWAGSRPNIRIVTTARHEEVPEYLNAMDLLCVPSQTTPAWQEQFGRMIVEAFACGVPVIGSDSGEIPNVIGSSGVIVHEKDENGWVAQIERLLSDKPLCRRFAHEGRQRAEKQYSWKEVARQYLEFFERLLT